MSVRLVKFTDTLQFASSIRQALVQGQEPALSFNSVMFDESPIAMNKIASAQIKTNDDAMDCITRQDVPADPTREWKCTHAVVIGSGSMKEGSQVLVIKDSNCSNPWFVESIDVMAFPGAEVRAQILDIFFDVALQLWRVCLCLEWLNSSCRILLLGWTSHGCMCRKQPFNEMFNNSTRKPAPCALDAFMKSA